MYNHKTILAFGKEHQIMVWILIAVAVVILDRITKILVVRNIEFSTSTPVIDGFFYLTYWKNKGAAWGILQNQRIIFIPLTIIIVCVMAYFLFKSKSKLLSLSLSFILGGAIGNFIDRAGSDGGVIDFFEFHFGSYIFPIFNVADSFVVIGTALLAYYLFFVYKEKEKDEVQLKLWKK